MSDNTVYVNGIGPDPNYKLISSCIEEVFLKSTDNLTWLSKGDTVLLKPALNSGYPYPSTTHPLSLHVIKEILTENGAKVIVGDQSGIREVLHNSGGVVYGSTKENYKIARIGTEADEQFIGFEEEGWDDGFSHYSSDKTSSWPNGFFVTNWANKVDHIVNLPRLSTHSQAGATLGFKNMVGIIRDDNRMDFHANGPYNFPIKLAGRRGGLKSIDDKSDTFFEKIVEISDAIKDKHRLTLFVATKAQATFGPNLYTLKLGNSGIAKAYIVNLNPGMVFASADPVAAESFAIALLKDIIKSIPQFPRLFESLILFSNKNVRVFKKIPVQDHPYVRHAIKIGLGNMPGQINYVNVPETVQKRLREYFV